MTYERTVDGETFYPKRRGFRMRCCDCGLVHKMNFRLEPYGRGKRIVITAYRDKRATAVSRRWKRAKK